jgi:hypothetical protein
MTSLVLHTNSPLPPTHVATNPTTCEFGHCTHSGTCPGCQRGQALRHAAQLTAAVGANAQWNARLN